MAITEAVKEAIWLRGLLGDFGNIQKNIKVFCDNQSVIFLAKNQTYHSRTKHIDVKYHCVREIIESSDVLLKKINIRDNPSDMLTKVISGIKFQHCLKLIQILRLCWGVSLGNRNYGRLDPNLWVRRQSDKCNQCGSFWGSCGGWSLEDHCQSAQIWINFRRGGDLLKSQVKSMWWQHSLHTVWTRFARGVDTVWTRLKCGFFLDICFMNSVNIFPINS